MWLSRFAFDVPSNPEEPSNEPNCFAKTLLFDRLDLSRAAWQFKRWWQRARDNILDELVHTVYHLSGRIHELGAASRVSHVDQIRSGRVV